MPRQFTAAEWGTAWKEAKAEAAEDGKMYGRVRHWTSVLLGSVESHKYWTNSTLPIRRVVNRVQHPMEYPQ